MPHSAGCQTKNGCERSIDVVMISIIFGRMRIYMYEYRECQKVLVCSHRPIEANVGISGRADAKPSESGLLFFLVLSGVLCQWLLGTRLSRRSYRRLNQLYICRPPMWIQHWVRVRTLGNTYPTGDYLLDYICYSTDRSHGDFGVVRTFLLQVRLHHRRELIIYVLLIREVKA